MKRGRTSDRDRAYTLRNVEPASFFPPGLPPQYTSALSSVLCRVCLDFLNKVLLCNELVCCPCCVCYYTCQMDSQEIYEPPSALMEILASLTLTFSIGRSHITYTHAVAFIYQQQECVMVILIQSADRP